MALPRKHRMLAKAVASGQTLTRPEYNEATSIWEMGQPIDIEVEAYFTYFPSTQLSVIVWKSDRQTLKTRLAKALEITLWTPPIFVLTHGDYPGVYLGKDERMYVPAGPYDGINTPVAPLPFPHIFASGEICPAEGGGITRFTRQVREKKDPLHYAEHVFNSYWTSPFAYWDFHHPNTYVPTQYTSTLFKSGGKSLFAYFEWWASKSPRDIYKFTYNSDVVKPIAEYISQGRFATPWPPYCSLDTEGLVFK